MKPEQIVNKLNNCDLELTIEPANHDIELKFIIPKLPKSSTFVLRCNRIHLYKITRSFDENAAYFVGSVSVQQGRAATLLTGEGWQWGVELPETAWFIKIEGGVTIDIICMDLSWYESEYQ